MEGAPPSTEQHLANTLQKLTQTVDDLAKKVRENQQPGFTKRMTRRGLFVLLGAAAMGGWMLTKTNKDPDLLEHLPPNGRRYQLKLQAWLDDIVKRSDNRFAVTRIDPQGSVFISLPNGLRQQQGINSLTIETDQQGRLLHLSEMQFATTHLFTELFPEKHDIRQQTTFMSTNGGTLRQYEWYTENDALSGWQSSDNFMRRMQLENNGQTLDPESPLETLAQKLATPHRIALFQKLFGVYEGPSNFLELLTSGEIPRDFRIPFAEFHRRKFHGNCNDFAEMACEILTRHRYPMHLLTVRPKQQHEILQPWHMVAVVPTENTGFTIIDNGDLLYVNTLDEYAGLQSRSSGREMIVAPDPIGYVAWEKVDTAIGRWLQQGGVRR